MTIEGIEYVTKPSKDMKSCKGCVAIGSVKAALANDDSISETLCHKLGKQCLHEAIVWVVK